MTLKKSFELLALLFSSAICYAQQNKNFICRDFRGEIILQLKLGTDSLFSGNFKQILGKEEFIVKKSEFTGVYRKNIFTAKFRKTPRPFNKNTKWTDKSWQLVSPDRVDTLQVVFLVKDITTGKWNEEEYDFIEEKGYNYF